MDGLNYRLDLVEERFNKPKNVYLKKLFGMQHRKKKKVVKNQVRKPKTYLIGVLERKNGTGTIFEEIMAKKKLLKLMKDTQIAVNHKKSPPRHTILKL